VTRKSQVAPRGLTWNGMPLGGTVLPELKSAPRLEATLAQPALPSIGGVVLPLTLMYVAMPKPGAVHRPPWPLLGNQAQSFSAMPPMPLAASQRFSLWPRTTVFEVPSGIEPTSEPPEVGWLEAGSNTITLA